MNYDLGQMLYCVNDNNYVISGSITSIQTTIYKHHRHYDPSLKAEVTKIKQYSVNSVWYYSDKCFLHKFDAVQYAGTRIKDDLKNLTDKLQYLNAKL